VPGSRGRACARRDVLRLASDAWCPCRPLQFAVDLGSGAAWFERRAVFGPPSVVHGPPTGEHLADGPLRMLAADCSRVIDRLSALGERSSRMGEFVPRAQRHQRGAECGGHVACEIGPRERAELEHLEREVLRSVSRLCAGSYWRGVLVRVHRALREILGQPPLEARPPGRRRRDEAAP
jgi:hypothetical protein